MEWSRIERWDGVGLKGGGWSRIERWDGVGLKRVME